MQKKLILILYFLILISNIFSLSLFLDYNPIKQKKDFCGETVVAIMLEKIGEKYNQDYVHNKIFDLKKVKRGAYSLEILRKLKEKGYNIEYRYNYGYKSRAILSNNLYKKNINLIKSYLNDGYPVFFNWYPEKKIDRTFQGHFSLIVGYSKNKLYIYDPRWNNKIIMVSLRKFKKYFLAPTLTFNKWGFFYFIIKG